MPSKKEKLADLIIERFKAEFTEEEFPLYGYSVDIEEEDGYIVFNYIKRYDSCARWSKVRVSIAL